MYIGKKKLRKANKTANIDWHKIQRPNPQTGQPDRGLNSMELVAWLDAEGDGGPEEDAPVGVPPATPTVLSGVGLPPLM